MDCSRHDAHARLSNNQSIYRAYILKYCSYLQVRLEYTNKY